MDKCVCGNTIKPNDVIVETRNGVYHKDCYPEYALGD